MKQCITCCLCGWYFEIRQLMCLDSHFGYVNGLWWVPMILVLGKPYSGFICIFRLNSEIYFLILSYYLCLVKYLFFLWIFCCLNDPFLSYTLNNLTFRNAHELNSVVSNHCVCLTLFFEEFKIEFKMCGGSWVTDHLLKH
jgi:hypothetical protein